MASIRSTQDPYAGQAAEDVSASDSIQRDIRHLRYILGQLASYCNGAAPTAAAATALGTALGQWYFGIRNPAFKLVGARVYKAAAFSHTTSGTRQAVTFDTERYDQDGAAVGFHEAAVNPSRLTIPANLGGKYHFGAVIGFAASAVGVQKEVSLRVDGATFIGGMRTSWAFNAGNATELNVAVDYALNAAQYVEVIANQDIASPSLLTGPNATAGPEFWCHLIGS